MPEITVKESERLFGCFERTGRGDIDVNVFLMGLQMLLGCATPGDALRYCIKSMDPRSGTPRYITRYEIQSILKCVQIQHNLLLASNEAKGIAELTAATEDDISNLSKTSEGKGGAPRTTDLSASTFPSSSGGVASNSPPGSPSNPAHRFLPRHRGSSTANSRSGNSPPLSPTLGNGSVESRRAAFAAKIANAAKGFGDTKANSYFGPQTVLPQNALTPPNPIVSQQNLARDSLDTANKHDQRQSTSPPQFFGNQRANTQSKTKNATTNKFSRLTPIGTSNVDSKNIHASNNSITKSGGELRNGSAGVLSSTSDLQGVDVRRLNSTASFRPSPTKGGSSNNTTNGAITIGGSVGSGVAVDREFTIMHNAIVDLFEDTARYDYLGRMALREFVDYIALKLSTNIRVRRSSTIGGPTGVLDGGPLVAPAHRLNSKQLVLQHVHQTFVDTKGVNK